MTTVVASRPLSNITFYEKGLEQDFKVLPSPELSAFLKGPRRSAYGWPDIPKPVKITKAPANWSEIVDGVAEAFGVTRDVVLGRSRILQATSARCALRKTLRLCGISYPRIGRILGLNHTTVGHGCKQFDERATPAMREVVEILSANWRKN